MTSFYQVPLGLLFQNENINEEMIDIPQQLHDKYLPTTKHVEEDEDIVTVNEKQFLVEISSLTNVPGIQKMHDVMSLNA